MRVRVRVRVSPNPKPNPKPNPNPNPNPNLEQWVALLLLTLGCILVTDLGGGKEGGKHRAKEGSRLLGLLAVCAAAVLSSSSSVYFESMLKR